VEIGDSVKVIKTGAHGIIRALEGAPVRKAYVDVEPGADSGYIYLRVLVRYMPGRPAGPQTVPLNIYNIDDLEVRDGNTAQAQQRK